MKRGFQMIEIFIVVAILMIILAIAIPHYQIAQDNKQPITAEAQPQEQYNIIDKHLFFVGYGSEAMESKSLEQNLRPILIVHYPKSNTIKAIKVSLKTFYGY